MDQSELAQRLGLSKSSMSRILSGAQEPKLRLAGDLARILGVSLDYLVDDSLEAGPAECTVVVSDDEMTILKLVRRLGCEAAMDRLLGLNASAIGTVEAPAPTGEPRGVEANARPERPRPA